jgi:hypothetical protein
MNPRSECVFIDKRAFPLLPVEDATPVTIGAEPADCAQAAWYTRENERKGYSESGFSQGFAQAMVRA